MADQTKAIAAITDEIKVREAELAQIASDVGRAREAIEEADAFRGKIDDVSRKRAEAKAMAFVEGRKADTAEFDRQEKELERLSKQALEDSAAATIAIELLGQKSQGIQAVISELSNKRKQLAVDWLSARREAALDRYIKAIKDLCESAAMAIAADGVVRRLAPPFGVGYFPGMLEDLKEFDFPVPLHRHIDIPSRPGARVSPARWNKLLTGNGPEYAALVTELERLGVSSGAAAGAQSA